MNGLEENRQRGRTLPGDKRGSVGGSWNGNKTLTYLDRGLPKGKGRWGEKKERAQAMDGMTIPKQKNLAESNERNRDDATEKGRK